MNIDSYRELLVTLVRDSPLPAFVVVVLLVEVIREEGDGMGAAVRLPTDLSAGELRGLAKRAEDADQARRLLSPAAVFAGRRDG